MITRSKLDTLARAFMTAFPEHTPMSLDEFLLEYQHHLTPETMRIGQAILQAYPEHGGQNVIEDETGRKIIDLSRKYRTRSGHEVTLIERKPFNSAGEAVTFPIKGTINRKPRRSAYQTWTDDGRASVLAKHPHDLIEVQL